MSDTFNAAAPSAAGQDLDAESLRESVTTMALCGRTFEEIRTFFAAATEHEEADVDLEFQQRTFSSKGKVAQTEFEIAAAEAALAAAQENRERDATLRSRRSEAERRLSRLKETVRRKQRDAERQRFREVLDGAATRLRDTEQRLTEQQRAAKEQQYDLWTQQQQENERRATTESTALQELDTALADARRRLAPLIERRITKTVAGFLLWVGYGSFAAIGSTIALLLPSIGDDSSPLAQILTSVRAVLAGFPSGWPLLGVLGASLALMLAVVAMFGALVWGNDRLLQRFDGDWRREARLAGRGKGKNSNKEKTRRFEIGNLQPVEIRRTAYVQMLASLPYVVVTGALTCLLAASAHPAGRALLSTAPAKTSVSASIVATYLGTVVALLTTASFIMYIIRIIDPRDASASAGARWRDGWEFLLIPIVLVIAIVHAAATTTNGSAQVWGSLALFMLLSCLAVAHGVIFRGLFYDVDRIERERKRSVRLISELRSSAPPEVEDTDEITETRETLHAQREQYEQLESSLNWPGLIQEEEPSDHGWLRRRKKAVAPPISPHRFAVPDDEAAPDELETIGKLSEEIESIDRDLALVSASVAGLDTARLAARRDELLAELNRARAEADSLEFARRRALSELRSRRQSRMIEVRAIYDLAERVRPYLPPQGEGGVR